MSIAGRAADQLPELDPEATAELLDVLSDLFVWRLIPARWERVGRILDEITSALAAADLDAVREAIAELELASPVRTHLIGATELIPVPEPIRDRANHLVYTLRTEEARPTQGDGGRPNPGGGEGGERRTD